MLSKETGSRNLIQAQKLWVTTADPLLWQGFKKKNPILCISNGIHGVRNLKTELWNWISFTFHRVLRAFGKHLLSLLWHLFGWVSHINLLIPLKKKRLKISKIWCQQLHVMQTLQVLPIKIILLPSVMSWRNLWILSTLILLVQPSESTYFKLKAFLTFSTNTNKYLKFVYITKCCLHNRQYTNHTKSYDKRSIAKYHTVLYSNRNPEYDCKTGEISIYLEIRHQHLYFKMYLYWKY